MAFKDTILTFEGDKIVTNDGREVMMSWEAPIWKRVQNIYVIVKEIF